MRYPIRSSELDHRRLLAAPPPLRIQLRRQPHQRRYSNVILHSNGRQPPELEGYIKHKLLPILSPTEILNHKENPQCVEKQSLQPIV
jgi:hypothetical protein